MDKFRDITQITREEAIALFEQGQEAVVFQILEFAKLLAETQERLRERETLLQALVDKEAEKKISSPSSAVPIYEKENTKSRGKKKPGRKKGHKGERRERPVKVDREVAHRLTSCPICGGEVADSGECRERLIEDVPEVRVEVIRHVIYRGYCKTCDKIVEPTVTDALPKATIGLRLLALTAWLHYGLGSTINHIIEVLNFHLSFKLSQGGLSAMWRRLGDILRAWYDSICEEARSSSYLHADETGWRVDGQNHWMWCFTNDKVTCYMIDRSRGAPALGQFFKEVFQGVLITNFWKAYRKFSMKHQACFVHMYREIAKVTVKNKSEEWLYFRKKLIRWMRDAVRLDENDKMPSDPRESRKSRLHLRLDGFIQCDFVDKDCRRIQKRLRTHQDDFLTFLEHKDVPADNNKAEREIRPAVIIRKNSCHNKSKNGANTQAILMSIYRTLKIRGYNPIETIVQALKYYIENDALPEFPTPITSDG